MLDLVPVMPRRSTDYDAIVGTEDVMTPPKYSEFLCGTMPSTTMTIIEGGTHFVHGEYADEVNEYR